MLTGENGILTQAQNAKKETEQAKKDEMSELDNIESLINEYTEDVNIPQVVDENPGQLEQENETTFVINSIEDLVVFSYNVRTGNKYEGQTVKLGLNLDFKSDKSYVDPDRTDYGIYGYDGNLKQLLTEGEGFIPIGSQDETNCFYGTFDGNNNVICSLYENIDRNENIRGGLFSVVYGEMKNLRLINTNVIIKGLEVVVGGLTARSYNNIYNCYVSGSIDVIGSSWTVVGGICGAERANNVNIEKCYNLAKLSCKNIHVGAENEADISCGGVVAQLEGENSLINKCFNNGNFIIDGGDNAVAIGGICSSSKTINSGIIKNCYNTGEINVTNNTFNGHIGGIISTSRLEEISNCYNKGRIIANIKNGRIGGILGVNISTNIIENVYNSGRIQIKSKYVSFLGGIIGEFSNNISTNVEEAYNTGSLEVENASVYKGGSISATNLPIFNNCYYLKGTYSVGVGEGSSTGITELQNISDFPTVLEVVNAENAFMEDVNNINGGYPILKMEN